jgi:hypothetical protein
MSILCAEFLSQSEFVSFPSGAARFAFGETDGAELQTVLKKLGTHR